MQSVRFCVRGWKSWVADDHAGKTETIPALLRRRITPIGRYALSSAWDLPETGNSRLILSSRHGEFSRTLSLLDAATNGEDLSPADFTLSVHNALVGLLSIAHVNHRGHTAIAAGEESFCFGLLEAAACLRENPGEPVVLVHFDEPLPEPFDVFNGPDERPLALALALSVEGEGERIQFGFETLPSGRGPSVSHAHDFLGFLVGGKTEGVSIGADRSWRWMRDALD